MNIAAGKTARIILFFSIILALSLLVIDVEAQFGNERRLSPSEIELAEKIELKGELLYQRYSEAENLLAKYELSKEQIVDTGLSWASMKLTDSSLLVGLYERTQTSAVRLRLWHSEWGELDGGKFETLAEETRQRLRVVESALVATPLECGQSFAVLPIRVDQSNQQEIYALMLGRDDQVPLAKHYVFLANMDGLESATPLNSHCKVHVRDLSTVTKNTGMLGYYDHNPAASLPTAAHVFLSILFRDEPYKFTMINGRGLYTLKGGKIERTYIRH